MQRAIPAATLCLGAVLFLCAGRPAMSAAGAWKPEKSIEIVAQATQGLAVAHAADILHRDIKPANLFLVAGPKTHVKLLDFGVSKFMGPGQNSMTKEGLALGTFSYMPPEQMMGAKRVDARADIYSLGVVLYQCLVGTPPFVAKSIPALSNIDQLGAQAGTNAVTASVHS